MLTNLIIVGHALVAAIWWWMMPGGFPVGHPRFWVNLVFPWTLIVVALLVRTVFRAGRLPMLVALAGLWLAAAISARMTFPVTFKVLWVGPLLVGLCIAAVATVAVWGVVGFRRGLAGVAALVGIYAGAILPMTQRADPPGTQPMGGDIAMRRYDSNRAGAPIAVALGKGITVGTRDGSIQLQTGGRTLVLWPMLTFHSRSPDGCWTLLAPRDLSLGPTRRLMGMSLIDGGVALGYADDDMSTLEARVDSLSHAVELDARSRLLSPVWSHLNALAELTLIGFEKPSIVFSPCPDTPIEVVESDYPVGRPARFAYLGEGDVLHVVEARSAEKGPFRELASGGLRRNAAITLTLLDGGAPIFRVSLRDWAAQAGRRLSPTAGWGVPVNSIEFFKQGSAGVQIFVSLGATSVGRGFDSVGHAPGVYQSRVLLESSPGDGAK